MSCYEALAASYDGLTRDIPYEKYLRFFKSLLKQYGVKPKTVLDLACGTGSLSVLLAKSGYAVLGVDRSEDMLTVAAEKAMELEENQPFFVAQPMQRLRLPQPVDACVCALDSINYVTKPQDVQKTFCRIYESLRPGGLFVFDINTPYKLESLDGQVFLDETEDSYCVWRRFMIGAIASAATVWTCFSGWKTIPGSARSKSMWSASTRRRSCPGG